MKPGLLFLPFLALLVAFVGTAIGSAFPDVKFAAYTGWALAVLIVGLWGALDAENFKAMFQRKGAKYGASSGLVVVLGLAVIVGVAVITSRPRFNKSIDVTRDRLNTLSDQSFKLIAETKELKEPIGITAYFSDEKVEQQFRDLLALYQTSGANVDVKFVDPRTDPAKAMAEKITDANTVIFRHGPQEKRLSTFNEEKFSNALISVLKEKTKKIYFTKGHGEGGLREAEATGFNVVVQELENNKNTVEDFSLLEAVKVPEDANAVVIAGPKYDLKEEEARILEDYMKRGGAVMVMVGAMTPVDTYNKLLEKFGVKFKNDLLILAPSDVRAQMIGQNNAIVSEWDGMNAVTKDFSHQSQVNVIMRNTRSVEEVPANVNQLKVTLAGKTSKEIIDVRDVKSASDLENLTEERWSQGSFAAIAVASGKSSSPATANADKKDDAAKSDAPKDQAKSKAETRLVVVGSVDFANNYGAQSGENKDLFLNSISWLLADDDLISIKPRDPTKSTINVSTGGSQLSLLLLAFIYPLVFLGGGTVAWLRRRRT